MTFRLYDSARRSSVDFEPLVPGQVSIYCCGPTVQSAPHLGHVRKEVNFDVLRRWLEQSGYAVTLVSNITDIDDKILIKADEAGRPWWAHAFLFEGVFNAAAASLGVRPPTYAPRATGHIPEMLELVAELIDAGHAYVADDGTGDVYFDVASWAPYGELSGQRADDMEPSEDAETRGKRDPRDFALWKGHKESDPATASWPTPYGRGRPGWHLECSAMARKYLGDTFDIHGGAVDLRFPHHENEQAQSHAAGLGFARYWMHNAWLTAAGEKMSKSLGNGMSVAEITRSARPLAVRYYIGGSHYRSTLEFHPTSLAEAEAAVDRIEGFLRRALPGQDTVAEVDHALLPEDFRAAMDDDLNTSGALAVVHETVRVGNTALDDSDTEAAQLAARQVLAMTDILGVNPLDPHWSAGDDHSDMPAALAALVEAQLAQRATARRTRDFAAADRIRDDLTAAGIAVEDTPSGARWSLTRPTDRSES